MLPNCYVMFVLDLKFLRIAHLMFEFILDGYTANEMTYEWDESGVSMEQGISEAQYDIVDVTIANDQTYIRGVGNVLLILILTFSIVL